MSDDDKWTEPQPVPSTNTEPHSISGGMKYDSDGTGKKDDDGSSN